MLPELLRPAFFESLTIRAFSGFLPRVRSSNADTLMKRRPGLVGLYFLVGIALTRGGLEQLLDALSGLKCDHGLLPHRVEADTGAPSALLALEGHGVDGHDLDIE